jgi:hypothetical protein
MSQVSEMILATVSKVEDIRKSLIEHAFRQPRASWRLREELPSICPSARDGSGARIAKRAGEFNGGGGEKKFDC